MENNLELVIATKWWNSHEGPIKILQCTVYFNDSDKYKNLSDLDIIELWKNDLCLSAYGTLLKDTHDVDINFIVYDEINRYKIAQYRIQKDIDDKKAIVQNTIELLSSQEKLDLFIALFKDVKNDDKYTFLKDSGVIDYYKENFY